MPTSGGRREHQRRARGCETSRDIRRRETRMTTAEFRDRLGRFGVWRPASVVTPELAVAVERLGFGTLWTGSSPDGDLAVPEALLDATGTLMVGTSIVNIWKDDARTVARSYARLDGRHPGRFVLGVGAGHREATQQYERPYEALAAYVETLCAEGVPKASIVLAALGPKVLRLSGDRAAGAIPYLVPPEHTRQARAILGPGPLLARSTRPWSTPTRPGPGRSAGPGYAIPTSAWSTTPATCAGWAGASRTWPMAAATR